MVYGVQDMNESEASKRSSKWWNDLCNVNTDKEAKNHIDNTSRIFDSKSFNRLCRDPSLWNKLDLTTLSSYRFKVPHDRLGVWKDQLSSKKLNQLLSSVLDLSKGNTTYLIFNYYVYLSDLQLIYVAESASLSFLQRIHVWREELIGILSAPLCKKRFQNFGGRSSSFVSLQEHKVTAEAARHLSNTGPSSVFSFIANHEGSIESSGR
ncbi:hypothetical protein VNO77_20861 [Canavalia gladiata]|uniref:Uncharacterized protein n=1 Tax=Canavalia gladiata TaxID=3824 RepID=A0AAN9LQW9_CANGL